MKAGILRYDTTLTAKKSFNRFIRITLPAGTPFLLTSKNLIFKPSTIELTELVFNGSRFLVSSCFVDFNKTIHIYKSGNEFFISIEGQKFPLYFRDPGKAQKMFPLCFLKS